MFNFIVSSIFFPSVACVARIISKNVFNDTLFISIFCNLTHKRMENEIDGNLNRSKKHRNEWLKEVHVFFAFSFVLFFVLMLLLVFFSGDASQTMS